MAIPILDSIFGGSEKPKSQSAKRSVRTPAFALDASAFANEYGSTSTSSLRQLGSPAQKAQGLRFPRMLTDLDALRADFKPGFSNLRRSALDEIEQAGVRAKGDLKESLRRRRVLGSKFADNALLRAEMEIGRQKAAVAAQSFLEEVDVTMRALDQEFQAIGQTLAQELSELQVVAGMETQLQAIVSQNFQFAQKMLAEEARGRGDLFGTMLSSVFGGFFEQAGGELSDAIFGPSEIEQYFGTLNKGAA
jgi:hypothetical protein